MTEKISKADQIRALREANAAPARKAPARAKRPAPKPTLAKVAVSAVTAPQRKRGRPLIEDRDKTLAAQKPWEALGMSRSSWYRRHPSTGAV